jgi:hypothetical protein
MSIISLAQLHNVVEVIYLPLLNVLAPPTIIAVQTGGDHACRFALEDILMVQTVSWDI